MPTRGKAKIIANSRTKTIFPTQERCCPRLVAIVVSPNTADTKYKIKRDAETFYSNIFEKLE